MGSPNNYLLLVVMALASPFLVCAFPPLMYHHHLTTTRQPEFAFSGRPFTKLGDGRSPQESETFSSSPPSVGDWIDKAASLVGALVVIDSIVLWHEAGHYSVGRSLGLQADELSIGFGPKLAHAHFLGDDFSFRALPLGGYVSFPFAEVSGLPIPKRLMVFSAGVAFNFFLAFVIYLYQIVFGEGLSKPVIEKGLLITGVRPDGPAKSRLKPGDVILAVNGLSVMQQIRPTYEEAQLAITKAIECVQSTPAKGKISLTIQRSGRAHAMELTIPPKIFSPDSPPTIGVFLEPNLIGYDTIQTDNILEAASVASGHVFDLTKQTASGFLQYISDLVSREDSDYEVAGPVGVIQRATAVVENRQLGSLLNYAAALSVNLGVVNLIPFPPADGFQIVVALSEFLRSYIVIYIA